MLHTCLMLLAALFGTVGYALWLRILPRHLIAVTLDGVLSYGLYYLLYYLTGDLFISNFSGALLAALLGYLLAVYYHAPATVFYTAAIIPLVPGGMLYYMMNAAILGDMSGFLRHGGDALKVGLGIATGIILGSIAARLPRNIREVMRKRDTEAS